MANDRVTVGSLLILDAAFAGYASRYDLGSVKNPGMGFFPLLIGLGLGLTAGLCLWQKRGRMTWQEVPAAQQEAQVRPRSLGRVYGIMGTLIAFAALNSLVGFWVCTGAAMAALLRICGLRSSKNALAGAVLTAAAGYFLFEFLLGQKFPEGFFK
ncbi:MAG: hypothetical protein A3K30_03650 [Deltaproteobacteria bacterium RBG_13_51_10]|nr:MAG: hypothetical protein A3K30_03650 [Deltaproteobacteria bacterium RBG_13_51_10]